MKLNRLLLTLMAIYAITLIASCSVQTPIEEITETQEDAELENVWYYNSGTRYAVYVFNSETYEKTNGVYGVGSTNQMFYYEIQGDTIISTSTVGVIEKSEYYIQGDTLKFENRKMVKL